MMRVKVTAPNPITGMNVGVLFKAGVAEFELDSDETRAAYAYFDRHPAYKVEDADGERDEKPEGEPADQPPALPTVEQPKRSASKAEWVAYATANGMTAEEADTLTRDELAARYTPKEGQ